MLSTDAMHGCTIAVTSAETLLVHVDEAKSDRFPLLTERTRHAHKSSPSQQPSELLAPVQQQQASSRMILPPAPHALPGSYTFKSGVKRKRAPSAVDHTILPTPQPRHPYLSGNFAPIYQTLPLTPCTYSGRIPQELAGGQYVRNGSNPVTNQDLGRDAHWFDGDGMLAGVSFRRADHKPGTSIAPGEDQPVEIVPEFVNAFVQTDLYLNAIKSPHLQTPILPSIATLVNPLVSFIRVTLRILRTLCLVLLSHLPGSPFAIKKISVANTNLVYHDGRALATCESGPPMRVQLPSLETVGWYDGCAAEGETTKARQTGKKLGGDASGLLGWMREWTTAHPKVDPLTKEMLMFHSCFAPPYVQYSVLPDTRQQISPASIATMNTEKQTALSRTAPPAIINADVPGIASAKMMHDFGVSRQHTVIMDLPLSLDPTNQLAGRPPVTYDSSQPSRFGVFPRRRPEDVRWFETDAACIFHTANTWDVPAAATPAPYAYATTTTAEVNLLACRLTSATLVFAAGNIAPPVERVNTRVAFAADHKPEPVTAVRRRRMPFFSSYDPANEKAVFDGAAPTSPARSTGRHHSRNESKPRTSSATVAAEDDEPLLSLTPTQSSLQDDDLPDDLDAFLNAEECRLYYYAFDLARGDITHQWALSALPFEFPAVRPDREMSAARYVYGCSTTSTTSFGSALGKATKIDALVKIDAQRLIQRGRERPPRGVTGCVDAREMGEILRAQEQPKSEGERDPIQVFQMPEGWFAQEMRFVPAATAAFSDDVDEEDAGYLLFYAFDEAQLDAAGDVPDDADACTRACSELWVLDARDMREVVCRVALPQRVPYGLHGAWFTEEMIAAQRDVETFRHSGEHAVQRADREGGMAWETWLAVRKAIEVMLA